MPQEVTEVSVSGAELGGSVDEGGRTLVRLDRLLVKCGLAESATDAARKIKQGSVRVDNAVVKDPRVVVVGPSPARLTLRVGKQLRIALINL